jgi:ribonuclease P protein component
MEFTFNKIERLCSKKAIDVLFASGKSKTQYPIKLIYKSVEFESPFPVRAMFVVPKKKHKRANKRNILKRRMREIYRLHKHELYAVINKHKLDIMFIYLSNESLEYPEIEKCMMSLLDTLSKVDFSVIKQVS